MEAGVCQSLSLRLALLLAHLLAEEVVVVVAEAVPKALKLELAPRPEHPLAPARPLPAAEEVVEAHRPLWAHPALLCLPPVQSLVQQVAAEAEVAQDRHPFQSLLEDLVEYSHYQPEHFLQYISIELWDRTK